MGFNPLDPSSIGANIITEIILHITKNQAYRIKGTPFEGILKATGLMEEDFDDRLNQILQDALKIFFEQNSDYHLSGIEKALKDDVIAEAIRHYIYTGESANNDDVQNQLNAIFGQNSLLIILADRRKIDLTQVLLKFEDSFFMATIPYITKEQLPILIAIYKQTKLLNDIKSMLEEIIGTKLIPNQPLVIPYQPLPLPPKGDIPAPSDTLPMGSRMLLARSATFVGREDDLHKLAEMLLYNPAADAVTITATAAATGAGGLGKTQLAVEFAHRYGAYFYGVHWLDAANKTTWEELRAEVVACSEQMKLPNLEGMDFEAKLQATLAAWQANKQRLVILDNAESPALLQAAKPYLSGLRLLLTSRNSHWPAHLGLQSLPLTALSPAACRELLRQLAPHLDSTPDAELDKVSEALGGLPLAIDLASHYMADMNYSPQEYLKELEAQGNPLEHPSLVDWVKSLDESPTQHDTHIAASWLLSWRRLTDSETAPQTIFMACGYLAPNQPIPRDLLERCLMENPEDDPTTQAKREAAQALNRLWELGLLEKNQAAGLSAIHPLVAAFARGLAHPEILERLAESIRKASKIAIDSGLLAQSQPYHPHLTVLATYADVANLADAGTLWNNLGLYLKNMLADFTGAKTAYERALAIWEQELDSTHPGIAIALNNLGILLQELGDLQTARHYFERSLAIDEAIYSPDDPEIATDLNNLGLLLQDLGDLQAARPYFERTVTILESQPSPTHPNLAASLNNLGSLLHTLGDLQAARPYLERALAIFEQQLGPTHPQVAISLNNLGLLLQALGDLQAARPYLERTLAILEQQLGPTHPQVAISLNNLGLLLQALGDLQIAHPYFKRALAIDEAAYGPTHSKVALRLSNLGLLFYRLGDLKGAKTYLERALAIFQQTLPPNHPNIRTCQANLAGVIRQLGNGE